MTSRRSDQQWLDDLREKNGADAQALAIHDLRKYQYRVIFNYIRNRQPDIPLLADLNNYDLAELAQDCVQRVLMKLQHNGWARLDQYEALCPFLSWTVPIGQREAASILRRSPYSYPYVPLEPEAPFRDDESDPPTRAGQKEVMDTLQGCIEHLSETRRYALTKCFLEGHRSKDVATEMERTENAVNLLVMNARNDLRKCMEGKGFRADVLDLFE